MLIARSIFAQEYLQQYALLPAPNPEFGTTISEKDMRNAVKRFQTMAGIEATGNPPPHTHTHTHILRDFRQASHYILFSVCDIVCDSVGHDSKNRRESPL